MVGHPPCFTSADLPQSVNCQVSQAGEALPEPLPSCLLFPGLSSPPGQAAEATVKSPFLSCPTPIPSWNFPLPLTHPVLSQEGCRGPLSCQTPKHCLLLPYRMYLSTALHTGTLPPCLPCLLRHPSLLPVLPLSTSSGSFPDSGPPSGQSSELVTSPHPLLSLNVFH